jgi:hypothetical protein
LALIKSSFRRMRSDIARIATEVVYVKVGERRCCYRTDQWGGRKTTNQLRTTVG